MVTKQNIDSVAGCTFRQCSGGKLLLSIALFVFVGFSSGFSNNYSSFSGSLAALDAYSLGDDLDNYHPTASSFALVEVLEVREVLEETEHDVDVPVLGSYPLRTPAIKVECSYVERYPLCRQQKIKLYVLFQCWKHFLS